MKGSDQIIESNKSRPFRFGRLARDDDCEDWVLEGSSASEAVVRVLDAFLSNVRLRSEGITRVMVGLGGAERLLGRGSALGPHLRAPGRGGSLELDTEEPLDVMGAVGVSLLEDLDECGDSEGDCASETGGVPSFCVRIESVGVCDSAGAGIVMITVFSERLSSFVEGTLSEDRRDEDLELEHVSMGVLCREVDSMAKPAPRVRLKCRSLLSSRGDVGSGSIVLTTFPSASTTS